MGAEYNVLKIDEMTRVGELGGIEKYYRLQIKTKGGVVLTADVDEKSFIADKAAAILLKKAQEADAILKL